MIAKMNACLLSGIIAMDAEDFGNIWCNHFGGSLQMLHIKLEKVGTRPPMGKGFLVKLSNLISLIEEVR